MRDGLSLLVEMILERVKNTIRKYNLIAKGDKVVLGVSGGPDSVALVYLLNSLKKELGLTLHIAHLDHMLRKDSYKDVEFVKKLARRLNLPLTCEQINVRELAKKGSLEEIARNIRLGFLFRVANEIKTKKIALGHNLDDRAETVLMRILRGTGLYGLSGILPKREINGITIIRPLIEIKRKEIEPYLKKKNIAPRIDVSNLENLYFRNKMRNKLIPLLERDYNKNIKEVLSNLAETAGFDYDYLNRVASRFTKNSRKKLNLKKFLKLHPALQRITLRLMIAKVKGNMRRIDLRHIREIEELILKRPINSIVDLPKGVSVIKKKDHLLFYPNN
jgi:tRNA(Ile)-lysidine synthase